MSLFVGRLHPDTRERDLLELFSKYGEIERCHIKGSSAPFAFVKFREEKDAEEALQKLQGAELHGAKINIEWSRDTGKAPPGRSMRESECWECGGIGHFARDCRYRRERDRRYRSRSRSRYANPKLMCMSVAAVVGPAPTRAAAPAVPDRARVRDPDLTVGATARVPETGAPARPLVLVTALGLARGIGATALTPGTAPRTGTERRTDPKDGSRMEQRTVLLLRMLRTTNSCDIRIKCVCACKCSTTAYSIASGASAQSMPVTHWSRFLSLQVGAMFHVFGVSFDSVGKQERMLRLVGVCHFV